MKPKRKSNLKLIDLHTHTLFSDGQLIPAELVRRYSILGVKAVAITDHVDSSNLELIIPRLVSAVQEISRWWGVTVLAGVELTHIAPQAFPELTRQSRELGADIVVAHGETLVEPVAPGTNHAAIMAGVDILAHPGLITLEDAQLAREKGVLLEITSRAGHSLGNGHVACQAKKARARLIFNTDSHSPSDLKSREEAEKICRGAGIKSSDFQKMLENSYKLVETRLKQKQK